MRDMEWRPIETAPKDGTKVDLWLDVPATPRSFGMADAWRVIDCYYRDGKWLHFVDSVEKELHKPYITHWAPILRPSARARSTQNNPNKENRMAIRTFHLNVKGTDFGDAQEVIHALHTLIDHGFPFAKNPLNGMPAFNVYSSNGVVVADTVAVQVVLEEYGVDEATTQARMYGGL